MERRSNSMSALSLFFAVYKEEKHNLDIKCLIFTFNSKY